MQAHKANSAAVDLMWDTKNRLGDDQVAVIYFLLPFGSRGHYQHRKCWTLVRQLYFSAITTAHPFSLHLYLSIYIHPTVYLSIYLSNCLSVCGESILNIINTASICMTAFMLASENYIYYFSYLAIMY